MASLSEEPVGDTHVGKKNKVSHYWNISSQPFEAVRNCSLDTQRLIQINRN